MYGILETFINFKAVLFRDSNWFILLPYYLSSSQIFLLLLLWKILLTDKVCNWDEFLLKKL